MAVGTNIYYAFLAKRLKANGTETEVYVDRVTTVTGEAIATSDFATFGRGILTVNPDGTVSVPPEYISFTGIDTTNSAFTGAIRGLSAKSNAVITANKRYHPVGTPVAITFGVHNLQDIVDYIDDEIGAVSVGTAGIVTGTAGEDISDGESVYLKVADSKWWKADASTNATCEGVQLGIAQGAANSDGACTVLKSGRATNLSGLTPNRTYYISDTAGAISDSAGTVSRVIGVSRSATELYVDADYNNDLPTRSFVSTSSGASDSGKVAKLNADGRIPRDFLFRTAQTRLTLSGDYAVVNKPIPWDTEDYDDGTDALHDNTAPYDMVAISQDSMTGFTSSSVWYAQKIVTGANDYLISRLKVYLESAGTTYVRVRIRTSLSGSDLYDSGDVGVSSGGAWYTLNNVGLIVSPSTTYYVTVNMRTGPNNYKCGYNSTAPYSSGSFYTSFGGDGYSAGTWNSEDTSKDMALEVQIDNRPIVLVQQDGYYLVTAQLPSGDAANTKVATLYKNTTVIGYSGSELAGGESESNELLTIAKCVAGDVLYINVTASYGSPSVESSGASFCVFRIA